MHQVTADPLDYLHPRTVAASAVEVNYRKQWWLRCAGAVLPVTEVGNSRSITGHRVIVAVGGVATARLRIEVHIEPRQLLDLEEFDQPAFLVEKTARILADADNPTIKWESLQQEDRDRWLRMAKAVAPTESRSWHDFPVPAVRYDPVNQTVRDDPS